MMNELAKKICDEVASLTESLLSSEGFTLIDVEYRSEPRGRTLRLVVDREGGITLEDCADISHQVGDLLDAKADLHGAYHMEISSPGLDRPLTKPKHFIHFKGRQVSVKTGTPIKGKRDFRGLLNGFSDGMVVVQAKGHVYNIPLDTIVKAHLDY